jgi:chromosomal replication initiator protein
MSAWFTECSAVELTSDELILYKAQPYMGEVIESKFGPAIKEILTELLPGEYNIRVLNEETLRDYQNEKSAIADMDEEFTFERFVVGSSNKFAHAAALAVASGEGKNYNPLFIYGNSGLGKTHLLRAIRHRIHKDNPDYNIVYVKGDDFTNDLILALQTGKNKEFRERYRFANVFLVDDVQFIAGKQQTQEEFFHTFNTLYESGRQIVLTSDRPPHDITRLEDRLLTRFESGMLADIVAPDYETRMAIIRNKANELGFLIPEEVAQYLAETLSANIRQLEGSVKKIHALLGIKGAEALTVSEVMRLIKDMIRETDRAITADLIISETASFFSLSTDDLRGPRRTRNTARARQISMYLIRTLTSLSLADIGSAFEGRDHTTVLSAIRNIETELSAANTDLGQAIKDITANIQSKAEAV